MADGNPLGQRRIRLKEKRKLFNLMKRRREGEEERRIGKRSTCWPRVLRNRETWALGSFSKMKSKTSFSVFPKSL